MTATAQTKKRTPSKDVIEVAGLRVYLGLYRKVWQSLDAATQNRILQEMKRWAPADFEMMELEILAMAEAKATRGLKGGGA